MLGLLLSHLQPLALSRVVTSGVGSGQALGPGLGLGSGSLVLNLLPGQLWSPPLPWAAQGERLTPRAAPPGLPPWGQSWDLGRELQPGPGGGCWTCLLCAPFPACRDSYQPEQRQQPTQMRPPLRPVHPVWSHLGLESHSWVWVGSAGAELSFSPGTAPWGCLGTEDLASHLL